MNLAALQARGGALIPWLLCLLALSLPLSTSALSVLGLLVCLLWIAQGRLAEKWREIRSNPVCLALLAYLALFLIGLLWTEDLAEGLAALRSQWKLLLLPVVLTAIRPGQRQRLLNCYLLGIAVMVIFTQLVYLELVHVQGLSPEHLTRKVFHVVYNPMLALACYLLAHDLLWRRGGPFSTTLKSLLLALMVVDMFITEGRTGQAVFFVLLALLLVQYLGRAPWRALAAVIVLMPLVFGLAYQVSPNFARRVDQVRTEVGRFERDPNTSIGLRMLFVRNSLYVVREHPLIGVGTGDFKAAYATVNRRNSPAMVATDNPHNQYLLVLCRFGLVGLAALLLPFAAMVLHAWRVRDGWRRRRLAFPLFFLTIMLAESYLKVVETGFLFAVIGGLLYKRVPEDDDGGAS